MLIQITIPFVFLLSQLQATAASSLLVRPTQYGQVKGSVKNSIIAWYNIPYAQPPVGDLRFKAPQPPNKWTDIRDASRLANKYCATQEDCLYLNVQAPANVSTALSVLIWIHGGGFTSGNSYLNATSFIKNNIIVVSIEYRLGIFGFFYMGNKNATGNQGLRDQAMAIKWVYENIGAFGGDNSKITIGGCSAGGKST